MFDDLFGDIFDRDRRSHDGSQKPRRGLRGLIARVTGSDDRASDDQRPYRDDDRRDDLRRDEDDDRDERRGSYRRRERFDWDDD